MVQVIEVLNPEPTLFDAICATIDGNVPRKAITRTVGDRQEAFDLDGEAA